MALSDEQFEFAKDVSLLFQHLIKGEYKFTIGDVQRSEEQQVLNYKMGLSKTMRSQHLKKLAIDLNIFINGKLTYDKAKLQSIGDYWERLNSKNEWGGNWHFVDTVHF
jgi:peptidoglycan L-alanyl-D-glutamate endopeptidase CwlK